MSKLRNALAVAVLAALGAASSVQAADIILVNLDGANEGYNDVTVVPAVGGNPGTTIGAQRQYVAAYAAQLWGSILNSEQPIYIAAQFSPLAAGVLGSAGSVTVHANFDNVPVTGVWYNAALADAISGIDLAPTSFDISSNYSSNYPFYYGLDDNTPAGQINFLDVVMHEFGHGLGFQNFETEQTGAFFQNRADIYSVFTYDNTAGKYWTQMTNAERQASALNYGNVVFAGPNAKNGAALILDDRRDFRVTSPAAIAGNYSFGANTTFGPAISTANFTGEVVQALDAANVTGPTTTDGCTAITNNVAGKIALIDRGTCGFTVKVKNAQLAGAKAVIIAHIVLPTDVPLADTNPPGSLGGVDATITIPALRVSQAVGNSFKANLPMQVTYVIDPTKLHGADDQGRPRLFMPNPVQGGSSGSHYDTAAAPNLLMEPAINDSLYSAANLDITPHLMADIGWQINAVGVFPVTGGNAKVGSPSVPDCDTGVPLASQSGMFTGGSIQASNEVCLLSAQTRSKYYGCMDAARDRLVAAGLLTTFQGNKMMTCAKKVQSHQVFPIF